VEVCRRCRVVVEVVKRVCLSVGGDGEDDVENENPFDEVVVASLIDGNTYPLPSFVSPTHGLRVSCPLIAIEASLLFCFDFRLRPVFVIVLIHHRNAKGEHRHAAGRAGREHSN
jgi:hypothetical protein